MSLPPIEEDHYDRNIKGVFGTFGQGMGLRVCYIQAAIEPNELEKIHLVHEIPGSDRWPVRDLFQREVDTSRVDNGILPWLQDAGKVKFFSPLTLTLVPLDSENHILNTVPRLTRNEVVDSSGAKWKIFERPPLYRFKHLYTDADDHREFGAVEWNSKHVRLVAVDGQHRLSALKRYLNDELGPGHDDFVSWHIPIVISGLDKDVANEVDAGVPHEASILDVVRNIFVCINTQAKPPSKSRQILLNDEDINCVCTQELIQHAHENDVLDDLSARDLERIPLLFYDWRGVTKDGQEIKSPASLKSIGEIEEWFEHYLLGANLEDDQRKGLGIVDEADPLYKVFTTESVSPSDISGIREKFRLHVLPGVAFLLENFRPYEAYIKELRANEEQWVGVNDNYRHAISQLRFGSHKGSPLDEAAIQIAYSEIVADLVDVKSHVPNLVQRDIGMRGVIAACGELKLWYDEWTNQDSAPWKEFCEWFVKHLNAAYDDGWFGAHGSRHRLQVTHNAADLIINHKIGDASKAFGPWVAIVVCRYAFAKSDVVNEEHWDELWEAFVDNGISNTIRAGHEKQFRAEINTDNPNFSAVRIREEARAKANQSMHSQVRRFKTALTRIEIE